MNRDWVDPLFSPLSPVRFVGGYIASLIVCATVGLLMIGCSHLSLPPASRYRVVCGQVTYSATSVKAHGNWIELQTDQGPIWFNRDAVTSISPSR